MKKVYSKPIVMIEKFQVNEYIAGSCAEEFDMNFGAQDCTFDTGTDYFFGTNCSDLGGVNIVNPDPGHPGNNVCYHRPGDTWNFFNS